MRFIIDFVKITMICLSLLSCNKLSKGPTATPIDFNGLERVQGSAAGSFILSWSPPKLVKVENYEVFIQALDATQAKGLNVIASPSSSDSLGSPITPSTDTLPATKGQLISLVSGAETSFKTPSLDEGYYLFQVRALTVDGRNDGNVMIQLLQVQPSDSFGGLLLAALEGTNVHLKWAPSPTIRTDENFQYTIYKGPAFNTAVGFTKNTEFNYPLTSEIAGDTLYFGVRYTDGQGNEDRNTIILPAIVPDFNKDFQGCVSAQGVGSDRIRVDFQWPASHYSELKVFRNQKEVFSSFDATVTSFIDKGLIEGQIYVYTCEAVEGSAVLAGSNAIKASTLNTNPPTFKGITNAVATDGHTATLSWGVSTGVPTESYKLYSVNGNTVEWTLDPSVSAPPSTLTAQITGLGDDLQYSFGVRSCGSVACDTNTEQVTITMPDAGPPLSKGAESVIQSSGKVLITAPWSPSDGGVAKRNVYLKTTPLASTVISDYTLIKTVLVPSSGIVPTQFALDSVAADTTYYIIVRDEDSHGQVNQNTSVVSITTGRLTPPTFNSNLSLTVGPSGAEETSLIARFNAIKPHTDPADGVAKTYRVYIREGSKLSACSEEYYSYSLDATLFPVLTPPGNVTTITGLKPKTIYNICIKVMDKFNNLSLNEDSSYRQTLDTTKPEFDGVQGLAYDATNSEVSILWNASSSSDIYEYKMTAWLTSHIGGATNEIPLVRRATDSPDSFSFNNLVVPFQSQDVLEIIVNACDNAAVIVGGSQNCSTYTRTTALKITFADILAPLGFQGIAAYGDQGNTVPGTISVKWLPPSFSPAPTFTQPWVDYSGFRIYKLGANAALTLLKDCPCSAKDCPNQILTCDLTALDHYRTYELHVRAYDDKDNITILDPYSSRVTIRTIDTQKPAYTSNLTLVFNMGSSSLEWSAAIDNQYASEPGAVVTYEVYRKAGANFTNLLSPDGELLGETTNLSWTDFKTFDSGEIYYYTTCARDASANRTCDGTFKTVTIPDMIPPLLTSFTTTKTATMKSWQLDWIASDTMTDNNHLIYTIRSKESTDVDYIVKDTDDNLLIQEGGTPSMTNVTGSQNKDTYIHYRLTVADAAGNKTSKQITVYSQNKVVLTSVRSNEGPLAGNKRVFIVGDGFHSTSVVKIGTKLCTAIQLITPKHLTCTTPDNIAGPYSATVTNSDGSSALLSNAYKYCTPGVGGDCTNICNNDSTWDTSGIPFAKHTGRGGSAALPYVICNADQLKNMSSVGINKFFVLGENIDLSGFNLNNWVPITSFGASNSDFKGSFNGSGYAISNLTFNNSGYTGYFGIFSRIGVGSKIENFGLLNFNISAGNLTGALNGASDDSSTMIVQDIVVQGNVTGKVYVGGLSGEFRGLSYRISVAGNVSGHTSVGGVVGTKKFSATDISFKGTVSGAPPGDNNGYIGGIFGQADGVGSSVSNLVASGTVTSSPVIYYHVGGLIGRANSMSVTNSSFSGTVTCDSYCGGIIGSTNGSTTTVDNVSVSGAVNGHNRTGGIIGVATNVTLSNSKNSAVVSGSDGQGYIGGLIGYGEGSSDTSLAKISGSSNTGTISGVANYSGGLIGWGNRMEITSSYNTGNVTGVTYVGGLVGEYNSNPKGLRLTSSYNTGNVTGSGNAVGGVIGNVHRGTVTHTFISSFSTGKVSGGTYVGGFCGLCSGQYSLSYATGDVTGTGNGVGGFAGWVEPTQTASTIYAVFDDNYATGKVTATGGSSAYAGGFAGLVHHNVKLNRNYSTGAVSGFERVGGFVGQSQDNYNYFDGNYTTGSVKGIGDYTGGFAGCLGCGGGSLIATHVIKNNYSRGNIQANSYAGGFAGRMARLTATNNYSTGSVTELTAKREFNGFTWVTDSAVTTNNFWDKTTSGMNSSAGATGKTTTEMKTPSNFAGLFLTADWVLSTNSYPRLNWPTGATP